MYFIGTLEFDNNSKLKEKVEYSEMPIVIIGVNTIALLAATIVASIACMLNFDKGLRQHISTRPYRALPKDRWGPLTAVSGGHMIRERAWRVPASSGEAS
jgi:hypothetical protein